VLIEMHEMSLINNLMGKIEAIAREQRAERVAQVAVRLGALSHISAGHFREHFIEASRGGVADGAEVTVETSDDIHDPRAQDIMLLSVDVQQ
jgi:hydrogenase nickel incorporation protein HypA/HybF